MTSCNTSFTVMSFSEAIFQLVNTPTLTDLMQQQASLEIQIIDRCHAELARAYDADDAAAKYEVQRALFILNNLSVAAPDSTEAYNQYNPLLLSLKASIQERWLAYELAKVSTDSFNKNEELTNKLIELCQSHRASKHPIFDFFETEATLEQLDHFFKSDSALNIFFFDLVALMLPGSSHETRSEICKNLWDESGNGDQKRTHVGLYEYLLKQRNIILPNDNFSSLYSWQGYTGYNVFMLGATNRKHYYKSIGAMAITELLDPPQYNKLVKGITRLGIDQKHALYYTEHISIDVDHADGWLNKVIKPLIKDNPTAAEEILHGSLLRLQSCADYYDDLLLRLKS